MSTQTIACFLYEPDGTPLAPGVCHREVADDLRDALAIVLDRPGRVIQRCLLGDVRRVWVHLRDGALLPTQVERIFFDPTRGRVCALRTESVAGDTRSPLTAADLPSGDERSRASETRL